MHHFRKLTIVLAVSACTIFTAGAQKYKSLADTVKLNKDYGELNLELSKLNTRLISEKNKTANYEDKIKSMTNSAMVSGQKSKDETSNGTLGSVDDSRRAMKDAKQANNDAKDAQSAREKLISSNKKIDELQAEISKKQQQISALDSVKLNLVSGNIPAVSTN